MAKTCIPGAVRVTITASVFHVELQVSYKMKRPRLQCVVDILANFKWSNLIIYMTVTQECPLKESHLSFQQGVRGCRDHQRDTITALSPYNKDWRKEVKQWDISEREYK